jgi:hypothetical protein
MTARLWGWWSGASGVSARSSSSTSGVTTGAVESRPAVHHPVAEPQDPRVAVGGAEPDGHGIDGIAHVRTDLSRGSSTSTAFASFLAESRGEVPIPSTWPRSSGRQGAGRALV